MNRSYVRAIAGSLVAIVLTAFGYSDFSQRQRIATDGEQARGLVTGGEVVRWASVPLSHRLEVEYGPTVVFRVPRRFYHNAREQGVVTVRYSRHDMLDAVIEGVGPYYPSLFAVAIGLALGSGWSFFRGSR